MPISSHWHCNGIYRSFFTKGEELNIEIIFTYAFKTEGGDVSCSLDNIELMKFISNEKAAQTLWLKLQWKNFGRNMKAGCPVEWLSCLASCQKVYLAMVVLKIWREDEAVSKTDWLRVIRCRINSGIGGEKILDWYDKTKFSLNF